MKIKLKLLVLALCLGYNLPAQIKYTPVNIGKKKFVLQKTVIESNSKQTVVLMTTFKKQDKQIKFSTFVVTLKNDMMESTEQVVLEKVADIDEEVVLSMLKLGDNKTLMVSGGTRKKQSAIVLRIFSSEGQVLNSALLTDDASNLNLQVGYQSEDRFYISYHDKSKESFVVTEMDFKLKALRSVKNKADEKNKTEFERFFVRNQKVYIAKHNWFNSEKEMKNNPQFVMYRYDLNSGKLEKSAEYEPKSRFSQQKYLMAEKGFEIFGMSSEDFTSLDDAVLTLVRIDYETMEIEEVKTNYCVRKQLEKITNYKAPRTYDRPAIALIPYWDKADQSYTIMIRMCLEDAYTVTTTSSNGSVRTRDEFSGLFSKTLIVKFDKSLNETGYSVLENAFKLKLVNMMTLYRVNSKEGDFYRLRLSTDSTRFLVLYVQTPKRKPKLYVQFEKDGKLSPSTAQEIDARPKLRNIYQLKQMEELEPGKYLILVEDYKKGDCFLVIDTN